MNKYEARQEARRERLKARANELNDQATERLNKSHRMSKAIPFGQPIHIGHHSERRDRRYRQRIQDITRKGIELQDAADDAQRRADAVGTGGISSDDPDAITKLQAQLDGVLARQSHMKAVNKAIRTHKTDEARRVALAALGVEEADAIRLLTPDCMRRIGYPSFSLTNNNANARRIEQRIESLKAAAKRLGKTEQGNGFTYEEDPDDNRILFRFPGKPDEATRNVLKRHGFKWSPTRGAWVRQLTGKAIWAATCVKDHLNKQG